MYLSKLEIHGFKSFADRTVVDFAPGITVVVGPNGCGKSNIVDAVRWVIGEQRARILRSEKMDNIIFNGTSKRRALGMSEVLLTIENTRGVLPTEYEEVTIGRRLFRSGESEYLLNGTQCRLKDITDLFMDTGMGAGAYSVIELKMIEEILSENAHDRRHMFEEAAGITKYKIRRGQTLRKLSSTQTDLNRVRDLVEELDKRVSSLQRQAKRASRFKTYDERLHHLILSMAVHEYEKLATENSGLTSSLTTVGDQISGWSASLASNEADHEALQKNHVEKEQALVTAQTTLSDHVEMLRSAESDLRLNLERQEGIKRDLVRTDEEEAHARARRESLADLLENTIAALKAARPAEKQTMKQLAVVQKDKQAVEQRIAERRALRLRLADSERAQLSDLSERRREIERLASRVEIIDNEVVENSTQQDAAFDRANDIEERLAAATQSLDESLTSAKNASDELATVRASRTEQQESLQGTEASLHTCERKLDAVNAEISLLESVLSSYEDISESVEYLAESSEWMSGDPRTVADLISCDEEYVVALNQALSAYAEFLVVPSENDARSAISKLRSGDKGRAAFLILDKLSVPDSTVQASPVESAIQLASLVRPEVSEYAALVQLLLKDCYLVDDIEQVQKQKPPTGRYFTRSGEWYDTMGLRYGGSAEVGDSVVSSRIGRHEQLKRALETRDTLLEQIDELHAIVVKSRDVADAMPIDELEERLSSEKEGVVQAEKLVSQLAHERDVLKLRQNELVERLDLLQKAKSDAQTSISELGDGLESHLKAVADLEAKVKEAESELSKAESESQETFSLFNETNIVAVEARNRVATLEREEIRARSDQKSLMTEADARKKRVVSLNNEMSLTQESAVALEIEIKRMRQERGDLDRIVSESKDALMEVKVFISDLEAQLRDLRREREQAMADESKMSIRQAEITTRLNDLVNTIQEDYELDLVAYDLELDEDFEAKEARKEISELRSKIRNLGPINALALESFEDEQERLEFLKKQLLDLEHAETTLMETIDEINLTACRRFESTFEAIRVNFIKLFEDLFGEGASADIILENPNDPLESPIEVLAKPSGKKPSVLAQLSGGEKTLTAIGLLFSIYLVKPSPFCILDEVDAPLDDANIDRFMRLIRSFSDSTQFVLVTHNKRTMEAADRMYGITMAEHGVSQLVGVNFDPDHEKDLQLVA